jgi:hypothetical protein
LLSASLVRVERSGGAGAWTLRAHVSKVTVDFPYCLELGNIGEEDVAVGAHLSLSAWGMGMR